MSADGKHPLAPLELNESELQGASIIGPDHQQVATVGDVYGVGPDAEVILDVGGFLGIGTKNVALPAGPFKFYRDEPGGPIFGTTALTKDELKQLPDFTPPEF